MRARTTSTTSTGEIFRRAMAAARSAAAIQHSSALTVDRTPLTRQVEDHHLELRHLLDRVGGALLAEPRLLQASVRHQVRAPLWPPVDVQVARLYLAGELHRALQALGEDPRREAVVGVVGQRDGLVEVVERRHRDGG